MKQANENRPLEPNAVARRRAELILKVRSGTMSATQAAAELGVSRKTYYEWENRALGAMMQVLRDREPGRPPRPVDPEKEQMRARLAEKEKEVVLLARRMALRDRVDEILGLRAEPTPAAVAESKKNGKRTTPQP